MSRKSYQITPQRAGFSDVPLQEIEPAELARRANGWARPLRSSEVSCLLAHREAWLYVVSSGFPHLIIEDDAVLSTDTPELISDLYGAKGIDYVCFEALKNSKVLTNREEIIPGSRYSLSVIVQNRAGAGAYFLFPAGARKLLDFTESWSPLADSAMNLCPNVVRVQVVPAAATQAFLIANSTTHQSSTASGPRPSYPSLKQYIIGKLRRLRVSWVIGIRQLLYIGRSKERTIAFDLSKAAMSVDDIAQIF
ncbi:glycosyltransferase family 25 protein [Tabrizicola sp.]|uniref:glycosyltransferase family 25 protein n=1 Tax=Tabrizicola sp. TaxID=2005166 RepID=UPI003D28909A